MWNHTKRWWSSPLPRKELFAHVALPEIVLLVVAAFFFFRELGTFPKVNFDEALFTIMARSVASGNGYAIPVLGRLIPYPYFLAIGPTLILPAALSIKLFGFSMAVARLPTVGYLFATTFCIWQYSRKTSGREDAWWTTLLLITLSAYVNLGKGVMGEIPGYFFVIAGFLCMKKWDRSWWWALATGVLFGIAIVTKLTYILALAALLASWFVAIGKRDWKDVMNLTIAGLVGFGVYLLSQPILGATDSGFYGEISIYVLGQGFMPVFYVLRVIPDILIRIPFLAFDVIAILGFTGLWTIRKRLSRSECITIGAFTALSVVYFLNGSGWYRHLLPGHLALLPFVPIGAWKMGSKKIGMVILLAIIVAQAYWQITYKGSSTSREHFEVAAILERDYADTDIVVQQPDVFVVLKDNPHWVFLVNPIMEKRLHPDLVRKTPEQECMLLLRHLRTSEEAQFADRTKTEVAHRYYLIDPPKECGKKS